MSNALLETGLPSFETVLHNAQYVFFVKDGAVLFPKLVGCHLSVYLL